MSTLAILYIYVIFSLSYIIYSRLSEGIEQGSLEKIIFSILISVIIYSILFVLASITILILHYTFYTDKTITIINSIILMILIVFVFIIMSYENIFSIQKSKKINKKELMYIIKGFLKGYVFFSMGFLVYYILIGLNKSYTFIILKSIKWLIFLIVVNTGIIISFFNNYFIKFIKKVTQQIRKIKRLKIIKLLFLITFILVLILIIINLMHLNFIPSYTQTSTNDSIIYFSGKNILSGDVEYYEKIKYVINVDHWSNTGFVQYIPIENKKNIIIDKDLCNMIEMREIESCHESKDKKTYLLKINNDTIRFLYDYELNAFILSYNSNNNLTIKQFNITGFKKIKPNKILKVKYDMDNKTYIFINELNRPISLVEPVFSLKEYPELTIYHSNNKTYCLGNTTVNEIDITSNKYTKIVTQKINTDELFVLFKNSDEIELYNKEKNKNFYLTRFKQNPNKIIKIKFNECNSKTCFA